MKKGSDTEITEQKQIYENLTAPFNAGEKAGEIIYITKDGKTVGRTDIITEYGVEKATVADNLQKLLKKWIA